MLPTGGTDHPATLCQSPRPVAVIPADSITGMATEGEQINSEPRDFTHWISACRNPLN